mmetsp:Transcript_9656/g.27856  ORF Transcript_9656/g.27856 Transcript_9656/m.27856 type:complete len:103 (+) Transcript_9656:149-457(+)
MTRMTDRVPKHLIDEWKVVCTYRPYTRHAQTQQHAHRMHRMNRSSAQAQAFHTASQHQRTQGEKREKGILRVHMQIDLCVPVGWPHQALTHPTNHADLVAVQ